LFIVFTIQQNEFTTMKLSLDIGTAKYTIRAYESGSITVNDQKITRSAVIMPEKLLPDWAPQVISELTSAHLLEILEHQPELVLLGTGKHLTFPTPELRSVIMSRGVGLEVMDTASACRTYNILSSEDRNVAAAIMMI
jgi:uncharacterized protein